MSRCRNTRPLIARSVDGDLEPNEALRLARHMATCTPCRIVLARETRLSSMLRDADDELPVDESFFESVMASLPEAPIASPRRVRFRRGLKLAAWGSIAALGAAAAGRLIPSLRLDIGTPAFPRFSADETEGLISLLGAAASWVRMTAQSIAWAGSSGSLGPLTVGAVSFGAALAGALAVVLLSGALAWAARTRSRLS